MKRSKFDLSHWRLHSTDLGLLEPISCMEVLPGDSFRHGISALIRVSPLVAPVMHPVEIQVWSFFVPNRLVWDGWESFITNADSGLTIPQVTVVNAGTPNPGANELARSLGMGSTAISATPTWGAITRSVNALPLRGYNLITNQFFYDQDLDTPLVVTTGNGPDTATNYAVRNARWKKDRFTTARANPQKGVAGVVQVRPFEGGSVVQLGRSATGANTAVNVESAGGAAGTDINFFYGIDSWRQGMANQKFREARNRFGSRYTDYLRWLGVTPSDARLQRPEFLGGGRQIISFSEVLSTADTGTGVVGDMAGHGIAAIRTRPYKRFFEEHGYVISLMAARPTAIYSNAVPRHWFRASYNDYFQKENVILGEQPILKKEVNNAEADATANNVFGYEQRHDDYRRELSSIVGDFQTTLRDWHFGRVWDDVTGPVANAGFVSMSGVTEVPFADQATDNLRMMINHQVSARRIVPGHSRTA